MRWLLSGSTIGMRSRFVESDSGLWTISRVTLVRVANLCRPLMSTLETTSHPRRWILARHTRMEGYDEFLQQG